MLTMNWRRLAVGGMLAGVVLIALSATSTALFIGRQQLRTAMQGRPAQLFFVLGFLFLGVLMTWCYAAIRPRFGAGAKTAAMAASTVWLISVCAVVGVALKSAAMGEPYSLFAGPMWPMLYLLMMVASAIVGASVYKETQQR